MSTVNFGDLLTIFPEVELPLFLDEDSASLFSQNNDPFPEELFDRFLRPLLPEDDEYTEYVPCFRISKDEYHALVIWKASLLTYEYLMLVFDRRGDFLGSERIGGMLVRDEQLFRRVAHFDTDGTINIAEGSSDLKESFDPQASNTYELEILPNGEIYNSRSKLN